MLPLRGMSSIAPARLFNLDVLRGVAVALVLVRHMPAKPTADEPITMAFFQMGWTGVDLFFVLSGFLISGLLFREAARTGALRVGRFWLRRGLKIWPSYFAVYGLLAAVNFGRAVIHHKPVHVDWLVPNVFFFQNYVAPRQRWPHSWSVAIEEHFYLLLPLALVLLLRRGPRGLRLLPWIAAAVCVVTLAARCYAASLPGTTWLDVYYPTHFRTDSLCFGVLLGYAYHHHRPTFDRVAARAWPLLLAGMVAVLALSAIYRLEDTDTSLPYTIGFTLLYLGFGGAVLVAGAFPRVGETNPIARAVAWLGVYSYSIYLTHSVVMKLPYLGRVPAFLRDHVADSAWTARVGFWVLSIATGYLVSHLIEQPVIRLRSRWLPSA